MVLGNSKLLIQSLHLLKSYSDFLFPFELIIATNFSPGFFFISSELIIFQPIIIHKWTFLESQW